MQEYSALVSHSVTWEVSLQLYTVCFFIFTQFHFVIPDGKASTAKFIDEHVGRDRFLALHLKL